MRTFKRYSFVFRFHNLGNSVSYDTRILSVKDARKYYSDLCKQYEYVFMFKEFN